MIFFPSNSLFERPLCPGREILTFDIIFYFFATDPAIHSHRARDPLPGRDPQLPVARSIVLLCFLSFYGLAMPWSIVLHQVFGFFYGLALPGVLFSFGFLVFF